jgi:hypothetical protein
VLVQREMECGRSPLASIARASAGRVERPSGTVTVTKKQRTETATGFKEEIRLGMPTGYEESFEFTTIRVFSTRPVRQSVRRSVGLVEPWLERAAAAFKFRMARDSAGMPAAIPIILSREWATKRQRRRPTTPSHSESYLLCSRRNPKIRRTSSRR